MIQSIKLMEIDNSLASGERNSMLKDLGVLVKVGQHNNIAGLVGICEESGTVHYETLCKLIFINNYLLLL